MKSLIGFAIVAVGLYCVTANSLDEANVTKDDMNKDLDRFIEYYTQPMDSLKGKPSPEYITQKKLVDKYKEENHMK